MKPLDSVERWGWRASFKPKALTEIGFVSKKYRALKVDGVPCSFPVKTPSRRASSKRNPHNNKNIETCWSWFVSFWVSLNNPRSESQRFPNLRGSESQSHTQSRLLSAPLLRVTSFLWFNSENPSTLAKSCSVLGIPWQILHQSSERRHPPPSPPQGPPRPGRPSRCRRGPAPRPRMRRPLPAMSHPMVRGPHIGRKGAEKSVRKI